ncbi:MAG: manganese efflux pump MntP family protein [Clostridiales bacterium]|jgi:putative Mn2+ efflux pump MntP|nr:manganese efflux pump MntP family protein [Clostridiales bacterium]MDR2751604.1 manganese efflux pump MntP family protein [Clostridiales bacterium]
MNPLSIFLVALGLAADAFAVSVANGIALKRYKINYSLIFGFYFGLFQFLMPVVGYYAGLAFTNSIRRWSSYIAFGLLAIIGAKMFAESFSKDDGNELALDGEMFAPGRMCVLALATSMDALAVGFSFALMDVSLFAASSVIGVVAFALSGLGVAIGKKAGEIFRKSAERIGGLILIAIGAQILIKHFLGS